MSASQEGAVSYASPRSPAFLGTGSCRQGKEHKGVTGGRVSGSDNFRPLWKI